MGERDIELGRLNDVTTSARRNQHYFQEFYEFGALLDRTAHMIHNLKEANLELSSATETEAMKEIKGRMAKDLEEVGKIAHIMNEKLNRIFQTALTPILNNLSNGRGYSVTLPITMDPSTKSMIIALKMKFKERKNDLEDLCAQIKERHFNNKIIQLRQNFKELATLVETHEKIDKGMNKVKKVWIHARSTEEDLRDEMAENDRLLAENHRLFAIVIGLGLFIFAYSIFLLLV